MRLELVGQHFAWLERIGGLVGVAVAGCRVVELAVFVALLGDDVRDEVRQYLAFGLIRIGHGHRGHVRAHVARHTVQNAVAVTDDLQRLVLSHMDEVADAERADIFSEFHEAHVTDGRVTVVARERCHG